jgi:quercetin dioxygenase-like cupin family protein
MTTISWSDIAATEVYPGISRQILDGDRQTMVRYLYQPGSVFPEHHHPEEQVTVVISGQIEFNVAGETVVLTNGQAAVIPSNVPHGARVIGEEPVETFNAMSPRREHHPAPTTEMGNEG